MNDEPEPTWPHYVSTYCIHGEHDHCRLTCKTCQSPCRCPCHTEAEANGVSEEVLHQGGWDFTQPFPFRYEGEK